MAISPDRLNPIQTLKREDKETPLKFAFPVPMNSNIPEDQLLGYYWCLICRNLKISEGDFERLLNDYLEDPRNVPESEKISSTRACIKRQLKDLNMTMKTFMKGMKILRVEIMDMFINTTTTNADKTKNVIVHPLRVNLTKIIPEARDHDDIAKSSKKKEKKEDRAATATSIGSDPSKQ